MIPGATGLFGLLQGMRRGGAMGRGRPGQVPPAGPKPFRPAGSDVSMLAGLAPTNTGSEYDPVAGGSGGPLGPVPQGTRSLSLPQEPPMAVPSGAGGLAPWDGDNDPGAPDLFARLPPPPKLQGFDPAPQLNLQAEAGPMGKGALMAALAGLLLGGGRGALAAATGAGQGYLQGAERGHQGRMESWKNDMATRQAMDANAMNEWDRQFRATSAQQSAADREAALRQRALDAEMDRQERARQFGEMLPFRKMNAQTGATNAQTARTRAGIYGKQVDNTAAYQKGQLGLGQKRLANDVQKGTWAHQDRQDSNAIAGRNADTNAFNASIRAKELEIKRAEMRAKQKGAGVSSTTMTRLDAIQAARPTSKINSTYGGEEFPTQQAIAAWYNRFETFRRQTQKEYAAKGLKVEMDELQQIHVVPIQPRNPRTGQWSSRNRQGASRPAAKATPRPAATPRPTPRAPVKAAPAKPKTIGDYEIIRE